MISMGQYKGSLAEADRVADLLRDALVRAGVPEEEAVRVRSLVTGAGRGCVELGPLHTASAAKLCEALSPT